MIAALALFAQLAIVAHAPEVVAPCEAVEVSVAVRADGPVAPQVVPPEFAPFQLLHSSIVPHLTYGGAQGAIMTEFRYVIATEQVGTFTLGAFEARLGGTVARTRPMRIAVSANHPDPAVPTIVARARVDTGIDVNFRALTSPETVYVGQQANYEVAVFLSENVRDRLRRSPTFYPPDMQSMLAYDVPMPQGDPPRRRVGTRCFDALVYERALFPLLPGRFSIPPAQLTYSLALSTSFFSREESRDLQTDSTIVIAVEPPRDTRPADYAGAVGDLDVSARLDTAASRVGDPLLLTVKVAGTGNVKLFPRPAVQVPWASLVPAEERVQVDSTARRVRGVKEFDWVLTPRVAGELDLPPIRYSYFNPDARRYLVAATASTRVHVATGSLASADTAAPRPVLPLQAVYVGAHPSPLDQQPLFWALLAMAPVPALTLKWRHRSRRSTRAVPARVALRALARGGDGASDPCRVRRVFALALAQRLGLRAELFARPGEIARALRRAGVSSSVAADGEHFLHDLDVAAFSTDGRLAADAASRAYALYRSVDAEALKPVELALRPVSLGLVLLLAGAGALHALNATDPRGSFVHGVSEYYNGRYVSARDAFARAATSEPASAESWANLGTAAWAAGDTAHAVAAWQRALRLDPLADEVRDRMESVRGIAVGSAGYVPPVPLSAVVWLAVLAWVAAWGYAAVHAWRGGAGVPRPALALGAATIALGLAAVALRERDDVRRVAVLRVDTSLSTVPALGGEPLGSVGIGEVGRVTGHEGAWLRVSLDGGRDGWVPSTKVIPLESAAEFQQ